MSVIDITIKKVDGTTVEVSIDNTATVTDLKKLVQERTEIPKESQRLIFRGQILSDETTLKDSGLNEDGLTVHLVRHLVPPPHPKAPAATGQQQTPTLRLGATPGSAPTAAAGQNPYMAPSGLGMGPMGGMSPEAISEMMNNPVVDSMLSNPQIMRSLIEMNPQMQQLMQQNPELRTLIEDPEFLRQTMQAARNPSMMQEMMRTNDRQMANLDSIPGGYQALQRMYRDIQEPMWNAASGAHAHSGSSSASQLMEAMQQDREAGPNNRPLGNPWGSSSAAPAASGSGTQQQSSTAPRTTTQPTAPMVNPFASMFGMPPPPAPPATSSSGGASGQQQQQGSTAPNPAVNTFPFMAFPTPPQPSQPASSGASSTTTTTAAGSSAGASQENHHRNPFAEWLSNPAVQNMMGDMMSQMLNQQQQQQPGAASANASTAAPQAMPFFFPMGVSPSGTTPSNPQQFNRSAFGTARPSAAAPAAAVDPAQQFRPQLSALESMGFTNQQQNLNALRRANGNVNRALDLLLSEPQEGGDQADTSSQHQ
ncbi:hypothetical protein FOL47_003476 [Perkinsus chesapeaki]|uniref:Ubiquilin-4 n=1 Tax=Perkinsus chesapeaki TaxID=330153 RepID=A0A7J6M7N7_PERCH|nr:hypothetical protein FOL47_003476 [Perkinsus chesapeaki]